MTENEFAVTNNHIKVKERYCPKCSEILKVVTVANSAAPKSTDRNNTLPFDEGMKVYQTQFQCLKCRLKYSIEDLKKVELIKKKKSIT